MEKLVIFGNSAVAHEVFYGFKYDSSYEVVGFAVDKAYLKEDTFHDLPVVPFEEVTEHFPPDEYNMFIAVGYVDMNRLKADRFKKAKEMGYTLVNYISSKTDIGPETVFGENCYVGDFSKVGPFATVGDNIFIAHQVLIGHDVVVKDHCYVSAGAVVLGYSSIDAYCFIGPNATIRNKIHIAEGCVVGAGAAILEDTQEREVYVGRSAQRLPITSDKLAPN